MGWFWSFCIARVVLDGAGYHADRLILDSHTPFNRIQFFNLAGWWSSRCELLNMQDDGMLCRLLNPQVI